MSLGFKRLIFPLNSHERNFFCANFFRTKKPPTFHNKLVMVQVLIFIRAVNINFQGFSVRNAKSEGLMAGPDDQSRRLMADMGNNYLTIYQDDHRVPPYIV